MRDDAFTFVEAPEPNPWRFGRRRMVLIVGHLMAPLILWAFVEFRPDPVVFSDVGLDRYGFGGEGEGFDAGLEIERGQ